MNALRMFAIVAVIGLLGSAARSDEKPDYAKLIVGKWEVSKADAGTLPTGSTIEFTKDGKVKLSAKKDDADFNIEGTYKIEKDTVSVTAKLGDVERTNAITITKISEKELHVKDKEGKVVEFKKK